MKFQLSVGLYLLTVAWFMAYTRPEFQVSRRRRWLSGMLVTAALFEVLYITLQGALAQASHFNESDALHSFLYSLMGLGAVMLALMVGWQAVEIAGHRKPRLPIVLHWSIAWGLLLTAVLTIIAGFTISTYQSPIIGLPRSEADGIWLFGWATNSGDLRVAHFLGTHAMHIIPTTTWLLIRISTNKAGLWLGFTLLTFIAAWVVTYLSALAGSSFLPFV
ncbi:hypothetical protein [Saccharospirillum salsuginis]|nr:hypothetical protein [Saccharospirillum salsuginis]